MREKQKQIYVLYTQEAINTVNSIHQYILVLLFIGIFIFKIIIICSCILILLILADQIIHVTLSLGELHLIHTFTSIPVQKCFSSKHGRKLLSNALKHILNSSRISNKRRCHLQSFWRYITHR